ncbi:hypothetical protein N9M31_06950 [Alphaproteobacteria bacterium]|nr:hypothetical protein [Alphaproteobacteria bacterium]
MVTVLILSFAISLESFFIIAKEESLALAFSTQKYISLVLASGISVAFLISRFSNRLFVAFLSLLTVFNLFSVKLLLFASVLNLNNYFYWSAFLFFSALVYSFFNFLLNKSFNFPIRIYLSVFLVLLTPVFYELHLYLKSFPNSASISAVEEITIPSEWKNLKLNQKPNIYLLSYDSLIPNEIAGKYLGIGELHYQELIRDFFHEVPKSLTFHDATITSLNSVMRLDQKIQPNSKHFFAGGEPSLVSSFFRQNGYAINTGYVNRSFGKEGPYIDSFITVGGTLIHRTKLCLDTSATIKSQSRLLFLCPTFSYLLENQNTSIFHKKLFSTLFTRLNATVLKDAWHQRILEHIKTVARKKSSTFTFFYIYRPLGHTWGEYKHENDENRNSYIEYFREGEVLFSNNMRETIDTIEKHDPKSIVVIFGDHGAWLSRGVKKNSNPEFYFEDKHRVLVATMKTKNACSHPPLKFSENYGTPARLLLDVLICLGVDENKLAQMLEFDENEETLHYSLTSEFLSRKLELR